MLLLSSLPVHAHDLWLYAVPATLAEPGPVTLMLSIGAGMVAENHLEPGAIRNVEVFRVHTTEGVRDLREELLHERGSTISLTDAGTNIVAMQRSPSPISLDSHTFRHYVQEEQHAGLLASVPEGSSTVDERYSRHLKSLIRIGDVSDDAWRRPVGLRFEIVPLDDPFAGREGKDLRVLLLFEGEPLQSSPVTILGRTGDVVSSRSARTDSEGIARLTIPAGEQMLLRAVHLRPVPDDAAVDFESFWAAVSFARQ